MTAATLQHRTSPLAFRAASDGRTLTGWAVRYNVVDAFGTLFVPGVFDASLARSLPALCWGHAWDRPLGRVVSWERDPSGLPITARFDDPDEVPDVRQAQAQVRSGTVTALSVGFIPVEVERRTVAGREVVAFLRADLHEVSLVIAPAVPGSTITELRAGASTPDLDALAALAVVERRGLLVDDDLDAGVAYATAIARSRGA